MPKSTSNYLPSQDELRRLFIYCEKSGTLTWRLRPPSEFASGRAFAMWNSRYAGNLAGGLNPNGYVYVSINDRRFRAHRIVWTMANGFIPDGIHIDHVNGNCSDNRLENLRLVTRSENMRNLKMHANNTSGITGVTWHKRDGAWQARAGGKYLGLFASKDSAASAVNTYRSANGYSERHGA